MEKFEINSIPNPPRKPTKEAKELIFTYQGSEKVSLIIGLVFFFIGGLLSIFFLYDLPYEIKLKKYGTKTEGFIIDSKVDLSVQINNIHPIILDIFFLTPDGKLNHSKVRSFKIRNGDIKSGDTVEIEYLRDKPYICRLSGEHYGLFSYWSILVLIFPIIGFILTIFTVISNSREKKAYKYGIPIWAEVTFAGYDKKTTVDKKNPFLIEWSFFVNNKKYKGSISNFDKKKIEHLIKDNKILILYLGKNPRINTIYI